MARKILTNLDLQKNQLLNALAHVSAGDPASPVEGQFWYDSTAKKWKFRSDTATIDPTARANHSGTQTAATISDFDTAVRANRWDQLTAPTGPVSAGSQRITNVATPTGANDAANKAYVDAIASGIDVRQSVRAATTANITLSGTQTIDGVAVIAGDRVLVKNQTTASTNGLYVVAAGAWARAADADTSAEVTAGMFTLVEEGTVNADSGWLLTTDNPITLDTTALTFAQFTGAGQITAGAGLTKTGSTLDVIAAASGGITVNADSIQVDTAIVVTKYAASFGDGSAVSYVITHSLGTKDVLVSVYDNTTPFAEVYPDVEHTSTTTITLRFAVAPTTNQYRVVVHA